MCANGAQTEKPPEPAHQLRAGLGKGRLTLHCQRICLLLLPAAGAGCRGQERCPEHR